MYLTGKEGDWYIYPQFLAYKISKKADQNAQKSFDVIHKQRC